MYDTFIYGSKTELQLKNGECGLNTFYIGDDVKGFGYEDGIYIDTSLNGGYVVIWGGFYVGGFDKESLKDKYGNKMDFFRVKECIKETK